MESCNRDKEKICTEKEEGISTIERREKRGVQVHWRTIEKKVYQTLKVTLNSTSVFCRKERWKEVYGSELYVLK